MQKIQVTEANNFLNENGSEVSKAQKEMSKERKYNLAVTGIIDKNEASKDIKSIADAYKDAGISLEDTGHGSFNIKFTGDADDAEKTINDFLTDVRAKEKSSWIMVVTSHKSIILTIS